MSRAHQWRLWREPMVSNQNRAWCYTTGYCSSGTEYSRWEPNEFIQASFPMPLNELGCRISSRRKFKKRVLKRKQRWESHERSQNRGHWNGIEIKKKGEYKQAQDPKNRRKYPVNTFKHPDRISFDIQISSWKGHEHGKINVAMEIIPESPSSGNGVTHLTAAQVL